MTIAFTFPGQGSQKPGMGRPWTDHESWELVAEASDATGRDVSHLLLDADAEELTQTRNSQLATYVLSLVTLDAVERLGVEPVIAAGHSLGEYTALTAAGGLDFTDGVRLVAERGEAMQLAAEERDGTMAAVLGLDDDKVEIACVRAAADVWPANFNAPGNVVVAGDADAIDVAAGIAKELGASKVLPVKVSGAFHTPFMAPARDRLRKALSEVDFRALDVPVIANVDADTHGDPADWPGLLTAQLCSPVRWRQTLLALAATGVMTFVELGPGTVLTGTVKRTLDGTRNLSVAGPGDLDTLLERLNADEGAAAREPHEGEHLFMTERIVVSPGVGLFAPADGVGAGCDVEPGDVIGTVGEAEVRTPFAGRIEGVFAQIGDRVMSRQPIAWLRTA